MTKKYFVSQLCGMPVDQVRWAIYKGYIDSFSKKVVDNRLVINDMHVSYGEDAAVVYDELIECGLANLPNPFRSTLQLTDDDGRLKLP